MWTKWGVIIFLMAGLFSCEKTQSNWNKEINLATDTSLFIHSVNYVSHTTTNVVFDIELVQLNQLNSEVDYDHVSLDKYQDYSKFYTFSMETTETKIPDANYSTVLLMEATSYGLFSHGQISYFFTRYFEQYVNQSTTKNIGLATFRSDANVDLKFHMEENNLYANSPAFYDSIMYDLIRSAPYDAETFGTSEDFKAMILTVIDTLVANPNSTGQKSIIIVDDYINNYRQYIDDSILQDVIDYAVLNDVEINVICRENEQYNRLAFETGGFLIDDREAYKIDQNFYDYSISSIAIGVANLDRILSNDYTSYKFRVDIDHQGSDYFTSGAFVETSVRYNSNYFRLNLLIP